jgi:FtsP/CotA-like multicopper oxidase with cupredoxin domain
MSGAINVCTLLACLVSVVHAQCDSSKELEDLRECPMLEQHGSDGLIDLYMQPVTFHGTNGFSMRTRAYAGADRVATLPGPVLRVKSGSKVQLRLHNDLGPNPPSDLVNGYYEVNATNLHLHVSSRC